MRHIENLKRSASHFARSRDGNFAVVFGVAASVLALAIGFGVNTAQLYSAKSSLQGVVDAAVTSTARDLTTGVIQEDDASKSVKAFIDANSEAGLLRGDQIVLDKLTIDRTARTVEVAAHVDVGVYFPLFGAANQQRVATTTAAVYSDKSIEVAMMLDITGSMAKTWKTNKIGDLQAAARNAVGQLLDGQDPKNPRVRVAIVPYSEAVNTGKLAANAVFDEIAGGSNLPPLIDDVVSVAVKSRPDNCATERKDKNGAADFSDDGPYTQRKTNKGKIYLAAVNRDDRVSACPQAATIPLTADKQQLLATIDTFKAKGVTAGAIAAQWGYYMLSPKWRSAIKDAGLGNGPADFNKNKVAKVAILMTDGQFNTAFAGVKDGDTPQNKQGVKSRSYAENICANMKQDNIEIFTIGFDLNDPDMSAAETDQAKTVLKDCSTADTSKIKHYYEASTGEELDAAFKAIIKDTERLALTR